MTLGGHALVDVLAAGGVRRFYTVPGESFLEVMDGVVRDDRLTLVSMRHESGASFAAEADARMTDVPAVAMATRAVGAANLSIGVYAAKQASTPLIALLGHVGTDHHHKEAFQEVDLAAFYGPITKWSAVVPRASRLPDMAAHALHVATSGRPGPVMLALPVDILADDVAPFDPPAMVRSSSRPRPRPSADETAAAAALLNAAERPVMIVGGGARRARDELVAFAEAFAIGAYAAFRRQDVFPNDHPRYLGHLGIAPDPATLTAIEHADLVLVVGSRLDEMTTQAYRLPSPEATVIQIDIDPATIGAVVPVAHGIVADAAEALRELTAYAIAKDRDHTKAHDAWRRSTVPGENRASPDGPLDPAQVVDRMVRSLAGDTVVTNDAGNFGGFLHRAWHFNHPRTQLGPTSGAMGYAVPAALGAKLACPQRSVVAVAGDGGFLMTGQEIETSVRMDAPFTTVVFRNGVYGTIAMHQARAHGHTAGCDIGDVDLAAFARSLGADGVRVTTLDELSEALADHAEIEVSRVIDVAVDGDLLTPSERLSGVLAAH